MCAPHGPSLLSLSLSRTQLLIKRGADVDARSVDGSTPLHVSAKEGDFETAEFLLDHGASPTACNSAGQTPLQLALAFADDEAELIDLLRTAQTKHERRLLEEKAAVAAKPRPKVQIVWEKDLLKAAAEGGEEGAAAAAMLKATTQAHMSMTVSASGATQFSFLSSSGGGGGGGGGGSFAVASSSDFASGKDVEEDSRKGKQPAASSAAPPDVSDASGGAEHEAAAMAARRAKWGLDVDPRVFRAEQLAADPPLHDYRADPSGPAARNDKTLDDAEDALSASMADLTTGTSPSAADGSGVGASSASAALKDIDAALLSSVADKLMAWQDPW